MVDIYIYIYQPVKQSVALHFVFVLHMIIGVNRNYFLEQR
jgi:hypothetical protein